MFLQRGSQHAPSEVWDVQKHVPPKAGTADSACPGSSRDEARRVERALVVSIHDVAPVTRALVAKILDQLARHGVRTCSLLVVPNYHRQGRSLADPDFSAWLQQLEARGHEIVIHGFFHARARRTKETVREKIITRFYTADEAEFFDLDYTGALKLIRAAQDEFMTIGLRPSGFIAPAWLLAPAAERAAIDAGLAYTTKLRSVRDFVTGRKFASQSLVYSVRSTWRRPISFVWNRILFRRLTNNPLLRLSIHPPDLKHAAIWRQILQIIDEALVNRRPMTYLEWLRQHAAIQNSKFEMA